MMWQFLISCVLCIHLSDAFSMGPPFRMCVEMFPVHGMDAQTGESPYTLIVNATSYQPGDVIEVILNTTDQGSITFFEGAMVQARKSMCDKMEGVGMFTLPENETFMGLMSCQGGDRNTVAHKDHAHIVKRVFYWTAPSPAVGHIFFKATVVRNKRTFWTTVTSDFIRDASDNTTTPTDKCLSWVRTKYEQCPPTTLREPNAASMITASYLTFVAFLVTFIFF